MPGFSLEAIAQIAETMRSRGVDQPAPPNIANGSSGAWIALRGGMRAASGEAAVDCDGQEVTG